MNHHEKVDPQHIQELERELDIGPEAVLENNDQWLKVSDGILAFHRYLQDEAAILAV